MLQSPSDARRVLGLDRIPSDLRVVARLLILWVDESEEGRARSLSAELGAPRKDSGRGGRRCGLSNRVP